MELLDFEVKGQGQDQSKCGEKSIMSHFFTAEH